MRSDGSRKPSYDALHALVKGEWWMEPTVMRTDREGCARVIGWRGDYTATAKGVSTPFTISSRARAPLPSPGHP